MAAPNESTPLAPSAEAVPPRNCFCCTMDAGPSMTLTVLFLGGVLGAFGAAGVMMGIPLLGIYTLIGFFPPFLLLYGCYCLNSKYQLSLPLINTLYVLGFVGALPLSFIEYGITMLVGMVMPQGDDNLEQMAIQVTVAAVNAFFVAGFTEETFKYLMTKSQYANAANLSKVSPARSIVSIAFAASLGFATLENMMYVGFANSAIVAVFTGVARACISIPLHSATGSLIGIGLVKKLVFQQGLSYWHICFFPILIHGTFDFFLMASGAFAWEWSLFVGFGLAAIMMIVALMACARAYNMMVKEENRRKDAYISSIPPPAPAGYVAQTQGDLPPPYSGGGVASYGAASAPPAPNNI